MGEISREAREWPPKMGSSRRKRRSRELPPPKFSKSRGIFLFNIPASTLDPSKGGTGMRLNKAKLILIRIIK